MEFDGPQSGESTSKVGSRHETKAGPLVKSLSSWALMLKSKRPRPYSIRLRKEPILERQAIRF